MNPTHDDHGNKLVPIDLKADGKTIKAHVPQAVAVWVLRKREQSKRS